MGQEKFQPQEGTHHSYKHADGAFSPLPDGFFYNLAATITRIFRDVLPADTNRETMARSAPFLPRPRLLLANTSQAKMNETDSPACAAI